MSIRPINLLKQELAKLESARRHSIESFEKEDISQDLHDSHLANLTPLIEDYKYIIKVINTYA